MERSHSFCLLSCKIKWYQLKSPAWLAATWTTTQQHKFIWPNAILNFISNSNAHISIHCAKNLNRHFIFSFSFFWGLCSKTQLHFWVSQTCSTCCTQTHNSAETHEKVPTEAMQNSTSSPSQLAAGLHGRLFTHTHTHQTGAPT